jgi:general secretion pathway protein C
MKRALILSINGILLVACCFVAGGLVAAIAGAALLPPVDGEVATTTVAAPTARHWEDRQRILTRNLFNVSNLAPAEVTPVETSESYDKTRLPLRLLGTVASTNPNTAWAAVEDRDERRELVVRIGDRLKGRAEVLRIERRRIVLQNGTRREELTLEERPDGGPRQASARAPARGRPRPVAARAPSRASPRPNPQIERLGDNRFAVQRTDVEALSADPTALFSQARILPKYGQDGQMQGVQLNAIKQGSLFQQVGIQDGDTITRVNDIEVRDQQASLQVFQEFTQSSDLTVTVTGRDGNERTLEYEVR